MLSGGSTESTSLIWFAITVTVQTVPAGRSAFGSSVIAEPGEPLTLKAFDVPVGHSIVNELPVAVTASLKLTTMLEFRSTSVALSAGEVVVTDGATSCVVNENEWLAAGWSGGSPVSLSLMLAATAVTVQLAVGGRSESGSSVIVSVPDPLTPNVCALLLQEIVNELVVTSTGSLKKTWMFAEEATSVALSAGELPVTAGAASVVNENG